MYKICLSTIPGFTWRHDLHLPQTGPADQAACLRRPLSVHHPSACRCASEGKRYHQRTVLNLWWNLPLTTRTCGLRPVLDWTTLCQARLKRHSVPRVSCRTQCRCHKSPRRCRASVTAGTACSRLRPLNLRVRCRSP